MRVNLASYYLIWSTCLTYRRPFDVSFHHILPTVFPRELKNLLMGDKYLQLVYLLTCVAYLQPKVSSPQYNILLIASFNHMAIELLPFVLNQSQCYFFDPQKTETRKQRISKNHRVSFLSFTAKPLINHQT